MGCKNCEKLTDKLIECQRERDEANARVATLDEALTAALDDRDVFVEREKAANARAAGLVERDKSE